MDHEEDLEEIAARIMPALDLLLKYLAEGIRTIDAREREDGYDPEDDTATFAANVRKYVRAEMRNHLPLPSRSPMSSLHFDLGPYHLKVLHADDGQCPEASTKTREAFYSANDLAFSLNVIPPGTLVEIDEEITEVREGSLVLIWDSEGPDLTAAVLYQPSMKFPGDRKFDLLAETAVETEADFPGVRMGGSTGREAATGTDGGASGSDAPGSDEGGDEAQSGDDGDEDEQ